MNLNLDMFFIHFIRKLLWLLLILLLEIFSCNILLCHSLLWSLWLALLSAGSGKIHLWLLLLLRIKQELVTCGSTRLGKLIVANLPHLVLLVTEVNKITWLTILATLLLSGLVSLSLGLFWLFFILFTVFSQFFLVMQPADYASVKVCSVKCVDLEFVIIGLRSSLHLQ